MKVGLIQFDPVVGDLHSNVERLAAAIRRAAEHGADLSIAGELALIGYPPRDLVMREGLGEACLRAAEDLARRIAPAAALVGVVRPTPGRAPGRANSVVFLRNGRIESFADKRLLPEYDVFDEERYFAPGTTPVVIDHAGERIGVLICEDIWRAVDVGLAARYSADPARECVAAGATMLAVLSASPFVKEKSARQAQMIAEAARALRRPIVAVNQAGANDDLVFDGQSIVVGADGAVRAAPERWREGETVVDLAAATALAPQSTSVEQLELFQALRCGIAGYFRKTGHRQALIGLSGGIDSALVAVLACAALGKQAVRGVLMPSQYSSKGSVDDAVELAANLGMARPDLLGIELAHDTLAELLSLAGTIEGLADENLQSRIRGLTLMTLSNATPGTMVLTTGNKSEFATGYCTLGGDMLGGLAPLGDLLKTEVYALARWLNSEYRAVGLSKPPIPRASLDKPPSAELRPNQTDQDSLPPYEQLDTIVSAWIDGERDATRIAHQHALEEGFVRRWTEAIERAEYKRLQVPLVLKVSSRTFGRGRRMPIAGRFRPPSA